MIQSYWTIIPPLLTIIMVLLTRRVLLSLGVGIITAALFVTQFHLLETIKLILFAFKTVFIEADGLNMWNVYIILFIFSLGVMTQLIGQMGGTKAFGDWMIKHVKTRTGAQLMTMVIGLLLFIDDYFNSLTVGQVARPVTDSHNISRAKLAYIVDSTAAPVCVVAPISSWGAYVIGLIGTVLTAHHIVDYSELGAFLMMIPMNFYVWAALGVVIVIALTKTDFGPMKKHEQHAQLTGEVMLSEYNQSHKSEGEDNQGKIPDLLIPIVILLVGTILFIFWTGMSNLEEESGLIAIFGEADVSQSLFMGGILAVLTTLFLYLKPREDVQFRGQKLFKNLTQGLQAMLPAVTILIFAWVITDLIEQLGTGTYLAQIVKTSNVSFTLLPLIIFIMAGLIAFSTGTSWGSFALLLPIAGQIAAATDIELILPMLAAVLAGAVFGDHCSPISDTTILSATGAGCHHIDHVMTQLPYALVAASITGIGYLFFGMTESVWVGLATVLGGLFILYFLLKYRRKSNKVGNIN